MARRAQISLESELQEFREEAERPRIYVVRSYIVPCEPAPHPGWECPITGETKVKALEQRPDLQTAIVLDDGMRVNRWESDPDEWDDLFGGAVDWREASSSGTYHEAWEIPLLFKVPAREDMIDVLVSEGYETIYFSGGWRSGKTYMAGQKWAREWMLRGGRGRRFWLFGPKLQNAYRIYEKLFRGRDGNDPIFPAETLGDGRSRSLVAPGGPTQFSPNRQCLTFAWVDWSICEQYHGAGEGGHLEGDSVEAVLGDEITRVPKSGPYDVCTGRVMESGGPVILSGVPDDAGDWVYDKVVAPFESGKSSGEPGPRLVLYMSGYDNPWVPDAAIKRREDAETDPKVKAEKIHGRWDRHGRFAYADVWDDAVHIREELSHEAAAWGLGADITEHVSKAKLKHKARYIVGVDFNADPQTRVICKVFGKKDDWTTWSLVVVDVIVTEGDAKDSADELAGATKWSDRRHGARYVGAACVLDANAFHSFHRYGGRKSKTYDAVHYRNLKFGAVPPIKNVHVGKPSTNSNPELRQSRTVLRHLMKEQRLFVSSSCDDVVFAIKNAPRRRKSPNDRSTWMDKKVFNCEDSLRYVGWRIYGRLIETRAAKADEQLQSETA